MAAVVASYVVLSLPVVSRLIDRRLMAFTQGVDPSSDSGVQTIIVLDGDNRRGRLARTLSLWKSTSPRRVIVSGQEWLADRLVEAGVPTKAVERETEASTTLEQIAWLTRIDADPRTVAVVASRLQTPRVQALLRKAGIQPRLVPASIDAEPPDAGWTCFVPSYAALRLSRDAIYELVALRYYRARGWTD
jgi:uncharacterized SAM-binding protein YcdF (DUF218 family)